MKKKISILGSTGSIGTSALDVVGRYPDRFDVVALAEGHDVDLLAKQIETFSPKVVSVRDDDARQKLKEKCSANVEILSGLDGVSAVATIDDAEIVLSAIVGAIGMRPTYEAICAGKTIALANKESLVAAGQLMMDAVKSSGKKLLPVDSEHSAIFQSMEGHRTEDVKKIILTASGGPFRDYAGDLAKVTVAEALKHPNWSMGQKITIDSATMMNKGLEVIEAHWLFNLPEDKIDVVVHPESIVHSMVEYKDDAVIAQLAKPDMRGPIAYALAYPERIESHVSSIEWGKLNKLTFFAPDDDRFPMLGLAREAIRSGGSTAALMNAANEIAVAAFLEEKIGFLDIYRVVKTAMEKHTSVKMNSIDDVLAVDREGRRLAQENIG